MLELVADKPLIRRQAMVALATGLPVWIALPPDRPLRDAALAGLAVSVVKVADADQGISRSIIAGNAAIAADLGLLLWLADLPEIETTDLQTLLAAARMTPSRIVRATTNDGKPGHPIFFPQAIRHELAGLGGDTGARDLLTRHRAETVFVPLPGNRALTDLDTPGDWALWRSRQTQ